jgi:hypothetical protein
MMFESIKNLSISERIVANMSNSLNINDNSIVLLLKQDAFDDEGLLFLVVTPLVRM